jgi:prepilin-type N-terminal cleavage/methylation domain-containing protein
MKPQVCQLKRLGIRPASAFTLVEVMVGLSILAVALAGLYSSFFQGYRILGAIREERRATQILLQSTETLRLYTWSQLHNTNFLPSTFTASFDPDSPISGLTYTGQITVASCPTSTETYQSNISLITFTLNWYSKGSPHQRQVSTFVTTNGLYSYVIAAH